ncbi:uncharacterized protein LOC116503140 [Thamnophis elegans]|uniref:uncharacterized protein LOC116503140 n=1 Tax=Thamnophis elegans TaxID=35005 RepID=UPI001378BEC3|nr:uncharacterized protein LOC116503140 [Thamnophis elegans]XP_032065240.1 uncharacterized protein LOC116503140 [Thamnophis elegans]
MGKGNIVINVFCCCIMLTVTQVTAFLEPNLIPEKGNIWEYLAKEVLNTRDFCLESGRSVKDILKTCLIGVIVGPQAIHNDTKLRHIPITPSYSTIYDWGNVTKTKNLGKYTLHIAAISFSPWCFRVEGCRAQGEVGCTSLNNTDLKCNHTENIPHSYSYVRLPHGWFMLCGLQACSYIPANSTGGPCTLEKLTMLMPFLQRQYRRAFHSLDPDCESEVSLLTKAEYVSLAVSLVGVPGLTVRNSRNLNSLACTLAKGLNLTSQALAALNRELRQVREATLENRAAIDILLAGIVTACVIGALMCCLCHCIPPCLARSNPTKNKQTSPSSPHDDPDRPGLSSILRQGTQ